MSQTGVHSVAWRRQALMKRLSSKGLRVGRAGVPDSTSSETATREDGEGPRPRGMPAAFLEVSSTNRAMLG